MDLLNKIPLSICEGFVRHPAAYNLRLTWLSGPWLSPSGMATSVKES